MPPDLLAGERRGAQESHRRTDTATAGALRPARPWRWLAGRIAPPVAALVVLVVAWQLAAAHNPYLLPRPAATWSQLATHPGLYARNARSTLGEALAGLGIGGGVAVLLAVAMSQVEALERAVMPVAVVVNVTPVVAVAPALVVAFGFGAAPKLIVTALIVFFPVLITTLSGLRAADPQVLDVLRTLKASRWEVLIRVRFPSALPYLFTAVRVTLPLAIVGAVVAEFVAPGSSAGLGTLITNASRQSALDEVYAALLCLAAMGVVLTLLVGLAERRLLSWHHTQRGSQ